jgi:hypothetical protein
MNKNACRRVRAAICFKNYSRYLFERELGKPLRTPVRMPTSGSRFQPGMSPNSSQERPVFDLGVHPVMVLALTKKRRFSVRGVRNPSLEN